MNKTEYMEELSKRLRRLPKEDYERAMEYYEEYFADAGPENEAQVIEDLGTPEFAARQLVTNIAIQNTEEPAKDVKKGLNAVWVGILAVCAAPFTLPLGLTLVIMAMVFILMILMIFAMFGLSGVIFIITGPLNIAAGFTVLSESIPVFLSCLGSGLLFMGIGLLICRACVLLCRYFLTAMTRFFAHIIKKGGKKHEENK